MHGCIGFGARPLCMDTWLWCMAFVHGYMALVHGLVHGCMTLVGVWLWCMALMHGCMDFLVHGFGAWLWCMSVRLGVCVCDFDAALCSYFN